MTDDPTPSTTSTPPVGVCWKCGIDRDIFGDGSRKCSYCGAGDEPGWVRVR